MRGIDSGRPATDPDGRLSLEDPQEDAVGPNTHIVPIAVVKSQMVTRTRSLAEQRL